RPLGDQRRVRPVGKRRHVGAALHAACRGMSNAHTSARWAFAPENPTDAVHSLRPRVRSSGRRGHLYVEGVRRVGVDAMSIWTATTLCVIATCCYQVGIVMQKIAADRMPRLGLTLRQREVYRAFLRSPTWLGGLGFMIGGWVFFLKAIANAPVSIV